MGSQDLHGRVAMVTGGGSGLGRAVCLDLASHGARVLAADIDARGAEQTVELAAEAGCEGGVEAVRLDVTDRAAVDRMVEEVGAAHGAAFNCLVNNAGTDRGSDLVDQQDEEWHQVFAVNLHGPMYLSRAFVRHLLGHQERGNLGDTIGDIVSIVSISALTVGAGAGAYNSSKAALLKLTEVMQTEARERQWPARVTAVNPAAMATPMMDQWGLPAERMMDPATVAGVVRTAVTLPSDSVLQSAVITLRNEKFPR
jgi:NAD(P)-dependent dehydrogenase (short-subunit alcohol dehydrogenase family)